MPLFNLQQALYDIRLISTRNALFATLIFKGQIKKYSQDWFLCGKKPVENFTPDRGLESFSWYPLTDLGRIDNLQKYSQ